MKYTQEILIKNVIFFSLFFSKIFCCMHSSFTEMIQLEPVNSYIQEFPHMTFEQAQINYSNLPVNYHNLPIAEDKKNLVINFITNSHFETIVNTVINLPKDTFRNEVVLNYLMHGNKQTTDKFFEMPIGKALEWYAWCEEFSRGKMIFLPIFENRFSEAHLRYSRKVSVSERSCIRKAMSYGESKKIGRLDEKSRIECLYRLKQSKVNHLADSKVKLIPIEGLVFEDFLDRLKIDFFHLSLNDIQFLSKNTFGRHTNKPCSSRKELEKVREIYATITSFSTSSFRFAYRYRLAYSYKNITCLLKAMILSALPILIAVVYPVFCFALSKGIERAFCEKIINEKIVQDNIYKIEMSEFIKSFGKAQWLAYVPALEEECRYSSLSELVMLMPVTIGPLMSGYVVLDNIIRGTGKFEISVMALSVYFCFPFILWSSGVSFAECAQGTGVLVLLLGIIMIYFEWMQEFRIQESKVKVMDIEELLKNKNVVIE